MSDVDDLVSVTVWKPAGGGQWRMAGAIDTFTEAAFEPRHNRPGPWSLTMPFNTQASLIYENRLVVFDYRSGSQFVGLVEAMEPSRDDRGHFRLTVSGFDALNLLSDATCWPVPGNPITTQNRKRYRRTGPAETILGTLVTANLVTRKGYPVTVPPTQNRGRDITLSERFTNLLEVVSRKATNAGLGVRTRLVPTSGASTSGTLQFEFYTPRDRSLRVILSTEVGTVTSWRQTSTLPSATRAIVGGPGAGVDRVFRLVTPDTFTAPDAARAETTWGRQREVFVDARNADSTTDDGTAELVVPGQLDRELTEAATEALTNATTSTLAFDLTTVETEGMRFGDHFDIGDTITEQLLPGTSSKRTLGAARITVNRADGLNIQLVPGNPDGTTPAFSQARLLRDVRRHVTALERED